MSLERWNVQTETDLTPIISLASRTPHDPMDRLYVGDPAWKVIAEKIDPG